MLVACGGSLATVVSKLNLASLNVIDIFHYIRVAPIEDFTNNRFCI